jgi:hypothetical protein
VTPVIRSALCAESGSEADFSHYIQLSARDEIALSQLELRSVIPNLTEVSLDRLSELGDSVLAHSIAMYRERLKDNGLPLSSFNSKI